MVNGEWLMVRIMSRELSVVRWPLLTIHISRVTKSWYFNKLSRIPERRRVSFAWLGENRATKAQLNSLSQLNSISFNSKLENARAKKIFGYQGFRFANSNKFLQLCTH
jgi:hypothetical protein